MASAILFQIFESIRSKIQALELVGIASSNVVIHKVPSTKAKDLPVVPQYPAVIIAPYGGDSIDQKTGPTNKDDVIYSVGVWALASEAIDDEQPGQKQAQNLNQYLTWRERIRKRFNQQRLTTTLVYKIEVKPLDTVDRSAWEKGIFATGQVLNCYSRESRSE